MKLRHRSAMLSAIVSLFASCAPIADAQDDAWLIWDLFDSEIRDPFTPYDPSIHSPPGHLTRLSDSYEQQNHYLLESRTYPPNHLYSISRQRDDDLLNHRPFHEIWEGWPGEPCIGEYDPPVSEPNLNPPSRPSIEEILTEALSGDPFEQPVVEEPRRPIDELIEILGPPSLPPSPPVTEDPVTHDAQLSRHWPSNHEYAISMGWAPHDARVSEKWVNVPNHYRELSASWPSDHDPAYSGTWPTMHYGPTSNDGHPSTHQQVISKEYIIGHGLATSRHMSHLTSLSQTNPEPEILPPGQHFQDLSYVSTYEHGYELSSKYPFNHGKTISRSWPHTHHGGISIVWPAGHLSFVSQTWPPGQVQWPANHVKEESELYNNPSLDPPMPWFPPDHTRISSMNEIIDVVNGVIDLVPVKPKK